MEIVDDDGVEDTSGDLTNSGKHNKGKIFGKPFPKGKSGNPAGRPKFVLTKNGVIQTQEDLKIYFRKYGRKAAKKLVELLDSPDEKISLGATKLLLDRAYGKEATQINVGGEVSHTYADVLQEVALRLKEKRVVEAKVLSVTPPKKDEKA